MFIYTQSALHKVLNDFKKLARVIHLSSQSISILYLIYALIAGIGFTVLNAILLAISVAYLVFTLVMEGKKGAKITKQRVKEIYAWSKRGIKFLVICLTAYGLVFVAKDFSPLSLVLLLLLIFGFVLDILFYFIIKFLTAEVDLFMAGIKRDFNELKKPVQTVGNFFKKLSGKEIEPPPALTPKEQRIQDILDEEAMALLAKRDEEKQEKKQRKLEAKARRKQKKDNTPLLPPLQETEE